ncbi:hypothetical protein [Armatimonas sp.]|uniref:hypothetical protein n=1 Tax=Armatimonas sp. TaxID=1872638 RepID=UPI00375254E4
MIFVGLLIGAVVLFLLTLVPNKLRKPLIALVTLLAGCFYAVEFFWPTHATVANKADVIKKLKYQPENTPLADSELVATLDESAKTKLKELSPEDARLILKQLPATSEKPLTSDDVEKMTAQENFLTPYFKQVSDISNALQAFAIGLGIYSLMSVHLRNIAMKRSGWGNSATLIGGIVLMTVAHIGKEYIPDPKGPFKTLDVLLYDGLMKNLDATMFSIIAFYIVSAAYRAFRIRSVEATILLVAAALVMLGNVPIGQALTNWIPNEPTDVIANLRLENIGQWIQKRASSPATMAIDFGLAVGALATSLRLWLSLERGSYFEEEL